MRMRTTVPIPMYMQKGCPKPAAHYQFSVHPSGDATPVGGVAVPPIRRGAGRWAGEKVCGRLGQDGGVASPEKRLHCLSDTDTHLPPKDARPTVGSPRPSGELPRKRMPGPSCEVNVKYRIGDEGPGSEPFDDRDVGLAAALAHRLEAVAPAGPLQFVEQRRHELRAGSPDRMAERDGAAVDVHRREVGADVLGPRERDRGKRLVDLDQIDVVERHSRAVQGVAGG